MADIQFNLRIPEELKNKIKEAASKSGRSINAEAQIRLEATFKEDAEAESLKNKIANLENTVDHLTYQFDEFKNFVGYAAKK